MKVYLAHKMLLDLYRQVMKSDKLQCQLICCDENALDEHVRLLETYEKMVAQDYSYGILDNFDSYDEMYLTICGKEMELMRKLRAYIVEMQKNIHFVRFGKK